MRGEILSLVTVVVSGLALVGPGCKTDCEKLADRVLECPTPPLPGEIGLDGEQVVPRPPTKDELLAQCDGGAAEVAVAPLFHCLDRTDCAAFQTCLADVQRLATTGPMYGHVRSRDWTALAAACETYPPIYGPDSEHAVICDANAGTANHELGKRLRAARDAEEPPATGEACAALRTFAARCGPTARRSAATLCAEIDALPALAEARAAWASWKRGERPTTLLGDGGLALDCEQAIRELDAIDSWWARERVAEIRRACRPPAPKDVPVERLLP